MAPGIHSSAVMDEAHRRSYTVNGKSIRSVDGTLDLRVIGVNSGTCMDGIDIALVHYFQQSPDDPLHMELLQVSSVYTTKPAIADIPD